jgi:hypothetical protein
MNRRRLTTLFAITLPLVLLWGWRHGVARKNKAESALFFAYVDGPLNDYALSATRGLPAAALHGAEWREAGLSAARALESLKALIGTAPEGDMRARLSFVLPLYERHAALLAGPPPSQGALPAWTLEEKALGVKIVYMLEEVRYSASKNWRMPQSRFLELNALIFSLKETFS